MKAKNDGEPHCIHPGLSQKLQISSEKSLFCQPSVMCKSQSEAPIAELSARGKSATAEPNPVPRLMFDPHATNSSQQAIAVINLIRISVDSDP